MWMAQTLNRDAQIQQSILCRFSQYTYGADHQQATSFRFPPPYNLIDYQLVHGKFFGPHYGITLSRIELCQRYIGDWDGRKNFQPIG